MVVEHRSVLLKTCTEHQRTIDTRLKDATRIVKFMMRSTERFGRTELVRMNELNRAEFLPVEGYGNISKTME
ncbi:hypothetical protein AAJCM20276_37800 (plasmid) [Acetobacter aceti]|uniref:Uncharacterized protein n=1 Tax=Acetobacter aceti TaxID=435 RepID=A0A6S6PR85_ACEAC|nr:hypothetical protein AAJCM20276_37800 [Acetobacter aceti]